MRLDSKEIETVRTMVELIVGKGSNVRVFGSRLNDSKRGGDLDLLVESDEPVNAMRSADLKLDLEEKLELSVDIIFLEKREKANCFSRACLFKEWIFIMTPDPAELERQHLADLLEAMMRCAFFSDRLSSCIPWHLTGNLLESRCNDFDLFDKLAAFNERFSKLQDSAAATMRHATLLSGEKTTTFLEVLGFFEKVGVVKSTRDWQRIRALRNIATHDYSIYYADIALHFNGLKEILPVLLGIVVRLVNYCDTKLFIAPKKVFFESEWQHITTCYGR